MVLKSNTPDSARITSSASAADSPLFLSTRPSVSDLPTLPAITPGGPTGAGAAGALADPAAGAPASTSGRDGTVAAGVARSASRLIAPTEVFLSHTKTYRFTTTSAPRTSATHPPVLRAGGP